MQLLLLKGKEGMPVSQVSRMVYNLHTNLFDHRLNYYELHRTIRMYLWRQSQLRRRPSCMSAMAATPSSPTWPSSWISASTNPWTSCRRSLPALLPTQKTTHAN